MVLVLTASQNAMNRPESLGIYYDKERNKYVTKIRIGSGKRLFLGRFNTRKEAAEVYNKAVEKYHGKYSRGRSGA